MALSDNYFLGIDLGTSGVRGSVIDNEGIERAHAKIAFPHNQQAEDWHRGTFDIIRRLCSQVEAARIRAIAVDGTSSTVMLCSDDGTPRTPALMYNDLRCSLEAETIKSHAPEDSAAQGAASSLAKVLHLLKQVSHVRAQRICHQADWVTGLLCGRFDISDENNCLKLGYDPVARCWPDWLTILGIDDTMLPSVYPPGSVIAPVLESVSAETGLPANCKVVAGTTDSIAAFIATGANEVGDAVTSLGSSLVLKLLSDKPVYSSKLGVYSHRLGDAWLAGGASNSGGGVLLKYFSKKQLDALTPELDPDTPTGLDYYPLVTSGERFPLNDASLEPRLEPRPDNDVTFLQGMLEGMADIEASGYIALAELGAPAARKVYTAGGGSVNPAWRKIREQKLGIPVVSAEHTEASYGTALLAMRGYEQVISEKL